MSWGMYNTQFRTIVTKVRMIPSNSMDSYICLDNLDAYVGDR